MPVTPSGIQSAAIDSLRDLVAGSATFQSWTGTSTSAAAKERVYVRAVDGEGPIGYVAPFAIIVPQSFHVNIVVGAFSGGELLLYFEGDVSAEYRANHKDATYEFTNYCGAIIKEVMAGSYATLFITDIESTSPPVRADVIEDRDFHGQWFSITYGPES